MNRIVQLEIGNFQNFVYLIISGDQAMVVDPQRDIKPWETELENYGATLVGCLLTHSHWDHVAGVPDVARKYAVPVYVHPDDEHRLGQMPRPVARSLRPLNPEVPLLLGGLTIHTLHTPGHSAGEVCFLVQGLDAPQDAPHLLTGDTVFVGDVGRCDLETGNVHEMFATIQRLKTLPPNTVILPGHNYGLTKTSTVEREMNSSAAFKCKTVEELDALP